MIQITFLRDKFCMLFPSWRDAFMKAEEYLAEKVKEFPNDESWVEDWEDVTFLRHFSEEAHKYENVVGNTIRFDDTDGELYSKIYDGCLQATISYGCHEDGMGWNPFGHWCGECTNGDCHGCPNEFVGFVREENE